MSPNAALAPEDFAGWFPFHITRSTAEPLVHWAWFGDEAFADPFFDQTLAAAFRRPLHLLLQRATTLAQLVEIAEARPARAPDGFIFHVSRCGSTLVAQMLGRLSGSRVLAEPQPLTRLLEDPRLSPDDRLRAVRALLTVFARPATPSGPTRAPYLVKLDARNVIDWKLLRDAFPSVPRLVVHRDPVEVLVSNLGSIPASMLPGEIDARRLGEPAAPLGTNEDYTAFVLSRFYAAAGEAAQAPGTLVMDYRELPDAVRGPIARHFGLSPTREDYAAMTAAAGLYSKDASRREVFTPDSAAKRAEATDEIRALAACWLEAVYRELCRAAS